MTPDSTYDETIFFTPGGLPDHVGPMVAKMIGGGDPTQSGGGQYAKVGISLNLDYTTMTEGVADDYRFYFNRGPSTHTLPLPSDVTSLTQLPAIVLYGEDLNPATLHDNLPAWADTRRMPFVVASLEWARHLDLPVSALLFGSLSDGGTTSTLWDDFNLDNFVEAMGKGHCALDASGLCSPSDNPAVPQGTDAWAGNSITFATPSMADATYASYQERNLRDAIRQLLAVASDPRYAGRLIGIGFEPEINMPAHSLGGSCLPTPYTSNCTTSSGLPGADRHFVTDYNPAMLTRFRSWLAARYGDATPMTDTNADGRTFWGDFGPAPALFPNEYVNHGWAAVQDATWAPLADHLTVPTNWSLVDPPRRFTSIHTQTVTPYWHMWVDFRVEQIQQRIDLMVSWMIAEGMPGERIFTHQMPPGQSLQPWRAEGPPPGWAGGPVAVIDYANDFSALNPTRGFGGMNLYGNKNFIDGWNLLENFRRRIDNWASQEFQPYIDGTGQTHPGGLAALLDASWSTRAHLLWPHYWGSLDFPVYEASDRDLAAQFIDPLVWMPTRFDAPILVNNGSSVAWKVNAANPLLESTISPSLNAAVDKFIVLRGDLNPVNSGAADVAVQVDFRSAGVWHSGPNVLVKASQGHLATMVFDMSKSTSWSGAVDGVRIRPDLGVNEFLTLNSVTYAHDNPYTLALRTLINAKKNTPRPAKVAPYAIGATTLPFELAAAVPTLDANVAGNPTPNLVVFGTNPRFPGTAQEVFDDWATTGNFEYVPFNAASPVKCGNVALTCIKAAAPNRLGLWKTGRFRRMTLPNVSDLHLTFQMGIQDSSPGVSPSVDGVRFRVMLRDDRGNEHELFDRDWRPATNANRWSDVQYISLNSWKGRTVDLRFETQGIGNTTGDQSAWGAPRIERLMFFRSQGVVGAELRDGWIRASDPTRDIGGFTGNSSDGNGLRVGDVDVATLSTDRAYRSILSFDTAALPDTATLMRGSLSVFRGPLTGNPFGLLGTLQVDVKTGSFGAAALEVTDFEAAASGNAVGVIQAPAGIDTWGRADFSQTAIGWVSKTGLTQYRLKFATLAANSNVSDWVGFHPGNTSLGVSSAPLLVVSYR